AIVHAPKQGPNGEPVGKRAARRALNRAAHMDVADVEAAMTAASGAGDLGSRIELLSRYFLGRPYSDNPLGGGPDLEERFSASTAAFDCVTLVETVLAAACAADANEFPGLLKQIRYAEGRVSWISRNHYMTRWARNNRTAGFVRDLTRGTSTHTRRRILDVVSGLKTREVRVRSFPKRWIAGHHDFLQTGDILIFASTKKNLDVFHMGFVVREPDRVLRHASRTARAVVDEPLESFLRRYRMSGVIVLRPLCRR